MTPSLTAPRGGHIPDPEQRDMALALANRTRLARARLKEEVHALPAPEGIAVVCEVVNSPPDYAEGMPVRVLVASILRWGDARSQRLLRRAGVSHGRTFGGLTPRQRTALAEHLLDA